MQDTNWGFLPEFHADLSRYKENASSLYPLQNMHVFAAICAVLVQGCKILTRDI